jgi:hypothetical protein
VLLLFFLLPFSETCMYYSAANKHTLWWKWLSMCWEEELNIMAFNVRRKRHETCCSHL